MVNPSNPAAGAFFSSRSLFPEAVPDGGISTSWDRSLRSLMDRTVPGHQIDAPHQGEEARRQLVEAGREFEAYFISYLLKVMRETIPQGAIVDKQGAYFHFLSDQEIGRRAAESGGIGIHRMFLAYAEQQRS
ncbi:hypothetical protein [Candidatus Nitrospira inopinata]|uniref:Flagellar protein FlgJ N-terminal domain-containing protein n=1 Tax=Candidatus Nitrospira inopinata TaxID=1715989 RepID=A0A0S4KX82_9BACT|nr:hypothetical protein [Candidatus Nitrospira inopinata]CUQ67126.1 protein of unknown function [Candidatus Nitrospira inopinata]